MIDISAQLEPLIDAALEADIAKEPPREYLGASEIGDLCERKTAFKWHGEQGAPFGGRGIRRFRMGHLHEDETARWLKLAGFNLKGEQLRFHLADGKFSGGVDGVIVGGPIDLPYELLWEHKIMKSTYWRETKRGGVEQHHPKYFGQMQVYMRQFGLGHALFTALNTDTSELFFELVPYDAAKADVYIDRAQRILASKSPLDLPRIGMSAQDFQCKFCAFKDTCWAPPKVVATPAPAWLRRNA